MGNWRDGNEPYWIGVEEGGYAAECDRDHYRSHADALAKALEGLRYSYVETTGEEMSGFCDHVAEPCPRCAAARLALASYREAVK
jgi:hypothetical protein